ncbi:hypothetical protein [Granulosicoccus antarcticus]|uniref:hypothetical protein n=1 Tax=Granulosicoccus antarcticus TaxID=437505 RepID=UPI0012FD2F2C|nr:hypothetical protein [Granulosicoccus antarcticus]
MFFLGLASATQNTRPGIHSCIERGMDSTEPSWDEPFFTDTVDKTILLHELPTKDKNGRLLAMLAQIVPIEELPRHISELSPRDGMTPFILWRYDSFCQPHYLLLS